MLRAPRAHVAITLLAALAVVIAAHVAAAPVDAECDGQVPYAGTVAIAHGAIVGVVSKVGQDEHGFVFASEVKVDRAVGVDVGAVWRGTAYADICAGDSPRVGARVVVLLGVRFEGVPPADILYTVGVTVTPIEVMRLAAELPNTATAAVNGQRDAGPGMPLLFAVVVLVVPLCLVLPARLPTRRLSEPTCRHQPHERTCINGRYQADHVEDQQLFGASVGEGGADGQTSILLRRDVGGPQR